MDTNTKAPTEQAKTLIHDFTERLRGFSPEETIAVGRAWMGVAKDRGVDPNQINNLVTETYKTATKEHATK